MGYMISVDKTSFLFATGVGVVGEEILTCLYFTLTVFRLQVMRRIFLQLLGCLVLLLGSRQEINFQYCQELF